MKACKLYNLDLLKTDFELSRTTSGLTLEANCKFTTYCSVANPLILCVPPQIFIVAERTRGDLVISLTKREFAPTHSGVNTSKPRTSREVTNLPAESFSYLVHNLWLFFTSQITLRRSGAIG